MDKKAMFFCVILGTFLLILTSLKFVTLHYKSQKPMTLEDPTGHPRTSAELTVLLHRLAKKINLAKKHVRGTKTGDALSDAKNLLGQILKLLGSNYESVTKREIHQPMSVCKEKYKGSKYGYPIFNTGFVVDNCTADTSLDKLVTIITVYDISATYDVSVLLKSIRDYNENVPVLVGITNKVIYKRINKVSNVEFLSFPNEIYLGKVWNALLQRVKTKYVLFAREVTWFNSDARLDRLIRQIERLNVGAAGGALRDQQGHWIVGCQQLAFRNFTLVYEAGYDESIEECQFCDHIDGPFVMSTQKARTTRLSDKIDKYGLFEDLFLRLDKDEHVVCPDSMFFTNRTERSLQPSEWKSFATLRNVMKLKFSGREINMPCSYKYPCYSGRGTAISPCCHRELADLNNAAMNVCQQVGAWCELDSGSVMGSVKFHSVLPWERDADIIFLTANFTALKDAKTVWSKMGYTLSIKNTVKCCMGNTNRSYHGYFGLSSRNWRLEMWGMPTLCSEPDLMQNHSPTYTPLNGKWTRMHRNPGLYARNRYGPEIYQHAQHFTDTNGNAWQIYKTNRFLPCTKPGFHACLDRYNADGNMQFNDPIP